MRLLPCLTVGWLALGSLCAQLQSPPPQSPQQAGSQQPKQLERARPAEPDVHDDATAGAFCDLIPLVPATPVAPPPEPEGTQPVPEPSTLFLVGTGLLGVALTARRRRRSPS